MTTKKTALVVLEEQNKILTKIHGKLAFFHSLAIILLALLLLFLLLMFASGVLSGLTARPL